MSQKYSPLFKDVLQDVIIFRAPCIFLFSPGVKGIAKRAVKDTAKAAIGVDQAEVNRIADRSQDKDTNVNDIVKNLAIDKKKDGS